MSTTIQRSSITHSYLSFGYSLACYLASLISLTCFIVFVSGVYAPLSVNAQGGQASLLTSLLVNLMLISMFGLQHSVMARKRFKVWLLNCIPPSIERATYCLASSLALLVIPLFWMPMNGQLWDLSASAIGLFIACLGGAGWILLLVATFQLDHFELFGLKQTFYPLIGKSLQDAEFKTPGLYKFVRHPIQLGVLIGVWAVPVSTVSHVMLASGMTVYILVGLYFEEKALVQEFGNQYSGYKKRVAKLIPFIG